MKKSTDAVLVKMYISGKESALAQLIDRHQQKIYGFIYSKVYNHAVTDDIFQDTFIKVIVKLKEGKYNEEGKFLPWVMRIAFNQTIDYFRSQKKQNLVHAQGIGEDDFDLFDLIHYTDENAETTMIQEQIYKDVTALLVELPEDQKNVLELRLYRQMSFKDIAEETGVSINTALGRMRYALINLRKIIEERKIVLTK